MKAAQMRKRRNPITDMPKHGIIAGLLVITVVEGLIHSALAPAAPAVMSAEWVHDTVTDLGMAGPLTLVGLVILAIVVSPIPSGPIVVARCRETSSGGLRWKIRLDTGRHYKLNFSNTFCKSVSM
jgi:hypothetical protein